MKTYEEKYKKALEWMREVYPTLQGAAKEDAEYVFPELKESEDEKIKQELIEYHKAQAFLDGKPNNKHVKYVAWLEKQGSITKLSEEEQNKFAKGVLTSCALSFIDYLDAHKYEGKMCVSNGECEDIENAFHNAMWDRLHRYYCKYIEKQGKQNPTIIIPKFRVGDEIKTTNEEPLTITKIDEKGYWSENLFICDFDEECIWDLVEQKPAEWSEEDDEMLQQVIADIEDLIATETGIKFLANYHRHLEWLKSLKDRYTWKPSIAQLNALSIVSKGNAPDDIEAIVSLYNDLKKLKEE